MNKFLKKMQSLKERSPFLFASLVIIILAIIFLSAEIIGEGIGKFIYQVRN